MSIFYSLKDTLLNHLQRHDMERLLPNTFMEEFPQSVTIEQSISTWKAIVVYQQKFEQDVL